MAARKRLTLPRTMAVSMIRNGRLYLWCAAWRTISKSRLTSGCVIEELFLLRLLGKCVLSAACKATWAIPHQSSPEMDLGLRNIADADFIDRAAVPFEIGRASCRERV